MQSSTIWQRVDKHTDVTPGCWNWLGAKIFGGYGVTFVGTHPNGNPQIKRVHRLMYERYIGPIPEELQIDHLCRNRGCVNPYHLELVTSKENGRGVRHLRISHCRNGHSMSGDNLMTLSSKRPNGTRRCRECFNTYRRKRWAAGHKNR